jgi:hypothetical protein
VTDKIGRRKPLLLLGYGLSSSEKPGVMKINLRLWERIWVLVGGKLGKST